MRLSGESITYIEARELWNDMRSTKLITSFIVIAANYNAFNATQFWITFSILPFLMTLAEAFAPHTNDGPFLALVGCGFLTAVFLI